MKKSPPQARGPRLPKGTRGVTAEKYNQCEGGDLNPYGNNPASTSS